MGRGVDVDAPARRLQHGAHERDRGALAVGARHMDDGRQPAARDGRGRQQPLDPAERQVDPLRMQRRQAGQDGVDGSVLTRMVRRRRCRRSLAGRPFGRVSAAARTVSGVADNGRLGSFISRPQSRASVAFMSLRCTTMSTMPCACRYSARWNPSGSFSRTVCSMTRGPAKPISAPGSAMWMSPSMA